MAATKKNIIKFNHNLFNTNQNKSNFVYSKQSSMQTPRNLKVMHEYEEVCKYSLFRISNKSHLSVKT